MDVDAQFLLDAESFFRANAPWGLTFDDVSLATLYSNTLPREVDTSVTLIEGLTLKIPFISADMDTVTGPEMAAAIASCGGLGLLHYNMDEEAQIAAVKKVKSSLPCLEPLPILPEFEAPAQGHGLVGIRAADGTLTKLIDFNTSTPTLYPQPAALFWQGHGGAQAFIQEARAVFSHVQTPYLIVYNSQKEVLGVVGRNIEQVQGAYDAQGHLLCGAAIALNSTSTGDLDVKRLCLHVERLQAAGLNVASISTAHGHSQRVYDAVRCLSKTFRGLPIIAGNITSAAGARFLIEAGANILKVGQGPGSICTTRIVAGVGIPQMTALHLVATEARKHNIPILADGGLTKSGDIVKALTIANSVVCGGLLAGCPEAPGECIEHNGRKYKAYRGMGSLSAMRAGSAARYGHDNKTLKLTAEGVEAIKEMAPALGDVLTNLVGGLRSGMGYLGAKDLAALRTQARYIRVSNAGMRESYPHDITVREAL